MAIGSVERRSVPPAEQAFKSKDKQPQGSDEDKRRNRETRAAQYMTDAARKEQEAIRARQARGTRPEDVAAVMGGVGARRLQEKLAGELPKVEPEQDEEKEKQRNLKIGLVEIGVLVAGAEKEVGKGIKKNVDSALEALNEGNRPKARSDIRRIIQAIDEYGTPVLKKKLANHRDLLNYFLR